MPARKTDREKLLSKTTPGPNGCIVWTGCHSTTGYGRVSWGSPRRTEYAHRASYETFVAETQKIAGLYTDLAKQTFKPYEGLVSKFTPAAH